MMSTTSKTALRNARRFLRERRESYRQARRAALAEHASVIAREDAIGAALEARHWYHETLRRLAKLEACEVVAHGGRWSSAALKRNGFDPKGA